MMKYTYIFIFIFVSGLLSADYDYSEKLNKFIPEINKKLITLVEEQLNVLQLCVDNNIQWPHEGVTVEDMKQVKKQAVRNLKKLFFTKFPKNYSEKILKEAKEQFKYYKIGEDVKFLIRGGLGMNSSVEGILHKVGPSRIQIGRRYISKSDIDEEVLTKFDKEKTINKRRIYIRQHLEIRKLDKEDWLKKNKAKIYNEALEKCGWIYKRNKWMLKKDLVEILVVEEKKALWKKHYASIKKDVYESHNFVYDEKTRNWVPEKVFNSMTYKMKRMVGSVMGHEDKDAPEDIPLPEEEVKEVNQPKKNSSVKPQPSTSGNLPQNKIKPTPAQLQLYDENQ
ncbi:MAG: hypothetical protein U9O87_05090 [Verrucomicrobiota bacterium]|nr:hypothetical protein [Verrucomicrobiota bacterium]